MIIKVKSLFIMPRQIKMRSSWLCLWVQPNLFLKGIFRGRKNYLPCFTFLTKNYVSKTLTKIRLKLKLSFTD